MKSSTIASSLVALAALADANPLPHVKRHSSGVPFSERSLPVRSIRSGKGSSDRLSKRWYGSELNVTSVMGGEGFTVPVTIGNQTYFLRLDTGSPDLWIHSSNVTCPASAGQTTGVEADTGPTSAVCDFANPGYDPTKSATYKPLPYPANYNQSFSGGEASGRVGTDDVTLGGITVKGQEIAIVDIVSSAFGDNGTVDGLFGLSSPSTEVVYAGANGANDSYANRIQYNTWLWNAVDQKLIEPYVTLDLDFPSAAAELNGSVTPDAGTLTLGGLPRSAPWTDTSVTVPNVPIPAVLPNGTAVPSYYWSVNTSYHFPGSDAIAPVNNTDVVTLLDSGTFISQLPPQVAAAWHQALTPPGKLLDGAYVVQCNASVPDMIVTVGGVNFTIPAEHLVVPIAPEVSASLGFPGYCASGIQLSLGGGSVSLLGDNWYGSVIHILDLAKNQITLVQKSTTSY